MRTRGDHALIEETGVRGRVKALFFMGILLGLVFAAGGGSFGRSNAEALRMADNTSRRGGFRHERVVVAG
jgi:hypothetical protein